MIKFCISIFLIGAVCSVPLQERFPKTNKNVGEGSMKAVHGPTSSIIDFRRACVVTYQVNPEEKALKAVTDFDDEVPINNLNECAYLCYQSACKNAVFEPGVSGSKGKCKTSTVGHEDCSGRHQRHYNFKTETTIVLSCVRCVGERPVTLSPDAFIPHHTNAPLTTEETPSATLINLESEAPTTELITPKEELPPTTDSTKIETSELKTTKEEKVIKESDDENKQKDASTETLKLEKAEKLEESVQESKRDENSKTEVVENPTEERALEVEKKEIEEATDKQLEKEQSVKAILNLENANTNLTELITETTTAVTQNATELVASEATALEKIEETTIIDEKKDETTTIKLEEEATTLKTEENKKEETTTLKAEEEKKEEATTLKTEEEKKEEATTLKAEDTKKEETTTLKTEEEKKEETPLLNINLNKTTLTTAIITGSKEAVDITTLDKKSEKLEAKDLSLGDTKQADVPLSESNDNLVKKSLDVLPTAAGVKTSIGKIEDTPKILNETETVNSTEKHEETTLTHTKEDTTTLPTTTAFDPLGDRGCLITFQADPLDERPSHFIGAFELIIDTRGPEICAVRCYQDGCTGALYFSHNGTCILGYGDQQYCAKRPLVKFLRFGGEITEPIWIHCVGCRSSKHGIKGEVLNFTEHVKKLKNARLSKLFAKPLFKAELESSDNSTTKTGNSGGPFGRAV